jgi:glycerophosphoryl diester phosphodiesterase
LKSTSIFAHRGSKGNRPENTLAAFREALSLEIEGIELDVQMTKDNHLVVIHDEKVDRTTNGKGYVKDLTLHEIKQLDAGSWFSKQYEGEKIPTLSEVLELVKRSNVKLNIELKNDVFLYEGIEEAVLKEVERYSYIDNVILSSFNHYSIRKCLDLNPTLETGVLFMEGLYQPWEYAKYVGATAIHVYEPAAAYYVQMKESNQFPIRTFTVNNEDRISYFIKNQVDAIFTDFPEKALEIRRRLEREGQLHE